MKGRIYSAVCIAILVIGSVYLARVDYGKVLDTDVTNLLPKGESPSARVLRSLISEKQGRLVYLSLEAPGLDAARFETLKERARQHLRESQILRRVRSAEDESGTAPYRYISEHKLELLFPKWLAEQRAAFEATAPSGVGFDEWAARSAVEAFDAFLESPAAMELARPELIDPLLLTIDALQELSAGGDGPLAPSDTGGTALFWAELAGSPLVPENQEMLATLIDRANAELRELSLDADLSYGGLVRLAAASRTRIQSDIAKINTLSLLVVLLVSVALIRPPWRFLYALPVVVISIVGAASATLLIFETVNIIVLVIGSILMGTAIDYAFHTLFAKPAEAKFPTNKLLRFACLSTIVGFGILLFSEMLLIRQIGVFVACGLASAFLGSQALPAITAPSATPSFVEKIRLPRRVGVTALACFGLVVLARLVSFEGDLWGDDIRNLEAPDPRVVEEDLALRERFSGGKDRQVVLSIGDSFASALQRQSELMDELSDVSSVSETLVPSRFLPTSSELDLLETEEPELSELFRAIETAFADSGYEGDSFIRFFQQAQAFALSIDKAQIEATLADFSETLEGPMAAMLDADDDQHWTAVSLNISSARLDKALGEVEGTIRLSQLALLNESLNTVREKMAWFGTLAMALIALVVLIAFGLRYGSLIVAIPILAGCFAVAVASFLSGQLNLFHLIGCFLGGTIALDYALFGVEALKRREAIPYSVWLSAATTGASFLVLTSSYIAAVRSLGLIVSIITLGSIILLASTMALARRGEPRTAS